MALYKKIYHKRYEQNIPISIEEAWDFFKSPANLKRITPDYMGFEITTPFDISQMYEGQLITYIVKPVLGIPMRWCTEITHIQDKKHFIDEQRFGPYSMWHHEHWFSEIDGGVKMIDQLSYALPFSLIGQLANSIFVSKQVDEIFETRKVAVDELFGKM